jgi:hypothetical protein
MSENPLPRKWMPKYYLKRIGEDDIVISQETRNEVVRLLAKNGKFVQIGEFTIMLNTIKSIDPYWPPDNIPPKPKQKMQYIGGYEGSNLKEANAKERQEWEKYFGKQDKLTQQPIPHPSSRLCQ